MSIQIKNKTFLLKTKNSSYGFAASEKGFLRHLHWGGHIEIGDLPDPDQLCKTEYRFMGERRTEVRKQEYPAWGGEIYTESALKVQFEDHVRCSILKYRSAVADGEKLLVTLIDAHYPLVVELHYLLHPEYDLIDRWCVVRNEGEQRVVLESALSAAWYPPNGTKYRMTHFSGRWGAEHKINRTPLSRAKVQLENRTGLSGPFNEPYFALDNGNASEEQGDIWFGTLQWSGNWKIAAETDFAGQTSIVGGIHDFDFSYPLVQGESFTTPVFTGGFSRNGFGGASRLFHDYQRNELMPREIMRKPMPLLFNSWGSMEIHVSEKRILEVAEKAAALGVELFVIDDGWQAWLGDWFADPQKFPNGLKPVVDKVRALGMDFGLWVEIESFEIKSKLYKEHPEWALRFDAVEPYYNYRGDIDRTSVLLNLARPEVAEYLYDALRKVLKETGIRYLKLDMNSYLTNPGWESVPVEKQQMVWVKYVENLYSIFQRLNEEFPEVMFENCAAGGGRADLGMMRYFSRINRSDNQDTLDVLTMHEGFTYLHPSRSAGGACHISDSCCGINNRALPLQYQAFTGMTGSLAIGKDLWKCPQKDFEQIAEYGKLYKKLRHIPQFGDMYRLQSVSDSDAAIWEFVSKDGSEALVFVLGHSGQFCNSYQLCRLRGLNPDSAYKLTVYGQNPRVPAPQPEMNSGRGLMEIGIRVPLIGDFDSRVLHYQTV